MQIRLDLVSPKMDLPGFDSALEKLTQARDLLAQLDAYKEIRIKVGITGLDKVKEGGEALAEMTAFQKSLITQMGALGDYGKNAGAKMKAGFKDAAAEIEYLSKLTAELSNFQRQLPGGEKKTQVGNAINVAQLRVEEIQKSMASASGEAASAVEKGNDKVTASLKRRKQATEETAAAESKLTARGDGPIIGRRFVTVDQGEREEVQVKRQVGVGHVMTETGGAATEDISQIDKLKHALSELEGQHQVNLTTAKQAGATEKELAQITRAHADAIQNKVREMKLGETVQGRDAATQSETLRRRAAEMDQKFMQKQADARMRGMRSYARSSHEDNGDATARVQRERVTAAVKDDAAAHEREIIVGRATLKSDAEKIAMLRAKAESYRQLAVAAKEAGNAELSRSYEKRGVKLDADATKIQSGGGIGGMLAKGAHTLGTVALWMTAYTAYFKFMEAMRSGVEVMIRYDAQTAQLQSVMRGTHAEAAAMRDTVLSLAVVTGRSGEEAMDAAIRWSRLGLTHKEVAAATEISLKSASISGLTAEQSTEALSGIVASFGLSIPELNSAFQQMNAMAIRFNASDRELMAGLSRTGALAHQMGMDLSQTMSLISLISGTTGRPGSEAGNAIKRYMTSLSKPEVQDKLTMNFGLKLNNADGSLKNEADLISLISLKYRELDTDQKRNLTNTLAGTMQASRLAIVLADLSKAQRIEVQALTDYNRADIENQVRRNTMEKDLNALSSSWGRFWASVGDKGGIAALRGAINGINDILESGELGPKKKTPERKQLDQASELAMRMGASPDNIAVTDNDSQKLNKFNQALREKMDRAKKITDAGGSNAWNSAGFTYLQIKRYFEEYEEAKLADKSDTSTADDINLEHLRAQASAYRKVSHNMGDAATRVKNHSGKLSELHDELENYGLQSYPEDVKASSQFNDRLRSLVAAEDREGVIALLKERQATAGQKGLAVTNQSLAAQNELVRKLQMEYDATEKLRHAAANDNNVTEEASLQKQLDAMKGHIYHIQNGAPPAELDSEGISATQRDVIKRGQFKGIESVYGALPKSPFMSVSIERERETRNRQLAALEDAGMSDTEKSRMDAEIRQQLREIEGRTPYAGIQDALARGERGAKNTMLSAAVGRNESQQEIGSERAAVAAADQVKAGGSLEDQAQRRATVEQYLVSLQTMQIGNEERMARLQSDITNEKRRQNEEASKALLMASREDQLRAALLQKAIRQRGRGFTANEFQFLSQETRGAIERYQPNALPPEFMNRTREIQREQGSAQQLSRELPGAIARLEATIAKLPAFQLPSDQSKSQLPQVSPSFHFSFGAEFKQLAQMVTETVKRPLQNELNNLRTMFHSFMADHAVDKAASAAGGGY